MTTNEAINYFRKFIVNQDLFFFKESEVNYSDLAKALEKCKQFERPDFYSIIDNTIYVFEHFEIDASKNTKKGSISRIDISNDNREFDKSVKDNDGYLYHGQISTKLSFKYYLENIYRNFDNHYKKISDYKKNICKTLNITESDYIFKVVFMIEDTTIFGASYFERGMKAAIPFFSNEFLDFIHDKLEVEHLIYSVEGSQNAKCTWLYSPKDILYFRSKSINLLEKEIINFNPQTIGTSIFIPYDKLEKKK